MNIKLEATQNLQTYNVIFDQVFLGGELTNTGDNKGFLYKTESYQYTLNSEKLKIIANKLDELNPRR